MGHRVEYKDGAQRGDHLGRGDMDSLTGRGRGHAGEHLRGEQSVRPEREGGVWAALVVRPASSDITRVLARLLGTQNLLATDHQSLGHHLHKRLGLDGDVEVYHHLARTYCAAKREG